jgi:hypothetical protein
MKASVIRRPDDPIAALVSTFQKLVEDPDRDEASDPVEET